jgi:hypothetical protein
LLVTFIELNTQKILQLEELELMNFLRRDMINETLKEFSLSQILPKKPKVKLTPFATPTKIQNDDQYFERKSAEQDDVR